MAAGLEVPPRNVWFLFIAPQNVWARGNDVASLRGSYALAPFHSPFCAAGGSGVPVYWPSLDTVLSCPCVSEVGFAFWASLEE